MLLEIYYEHYAENYNDRYWEMEEKSIPYIILFPKRSEMQLYIMKLKRLGYRCVSNNFTYRALLVNTELKRCAVIVKACKFCCVDDRNFTPEEFENEVFQFTEEGKRLKEMEEAEKKIIRPIWTDRSW